MHFCVIQSRQIACKISAFLSLISHLCAEKWFSAALFLLYLRVMACSLPFCSMIFPKNAFRAFFVSRNFSDVRECMKRLPVFRNREAYCHECGNNFLEKGMPWKILYMSDCQENNPKVDSLCKLLFLRYLRWSKIQGTYFKISALYFKIYGLCFLR